MVAASWWQGCMQVLMIVEDVFGTKVLIGGRRIFKDKNEPKWELKCSDHIPFSNDECAEFVVTKENEIFFITSNHYYIYDLDHRFWRELDLSSFFERKFPVAFAYTESLLSCNS